MEGAKFQRIDGGKADGRREPGVLWTALVPYDETLRRIYEANLSRGAASWGGLYSTPRYLARLAGRL